MSKAHHTKTSAHTCIHTESTCTKYRVNERTLWHEKHGFTECVNDVQEASHDECNRSSIQVINFDLSLFQSQPHKNKVCLWHESQLHIDQQKLKAGSH